MVSMAAVSARLSKLARAPRAAASCTCSTSFMASGKEILRVHALFA
jgi:hypothetical protein